MNLQNTNNLHGAVRNAQRLRALTGGVTNPIPDLSELKEALICPRCGAEIPEGNLYCEACGEEIHFVADFEPEVDDSIVAAMSDVASEIAAENGESAENAGARTLFRREDGREDAYFDLHIRFPKRAARILAVGFCVAATVTLAVIGIPRILRLQVFDNASQARETGAESMAEGSTVVYEPVAQTITAADAEEADMPEAPAFDILSGRYEESFAVTITNLAGDREIRYYYTTDGSRPDETSERYFGPILITEEGETTLRAVAVNAAGERSEEAIAVYTIDIAGPAAPVILEDSGEYTQGTMIVAVLQENCRITYTTDGSEPEIDSAEYTAPIKMPVGNSVFRFRAFNEEGEGSETVERVYHLAYARLVSEGQAVASVIRALVDRNVLIDTTGKVLGAEGYNIYNVESVIEIEGAGEYYRIVERYMAPDGSTADTGLLYAVNTNDGSVHRLGYDSSGKYTLYTLSGR